MLRLRNMLIAVERFKPRELKMSVARSLSCLLVLKETSTFSDILYTPYIFYIFKSNSLYIHYVAKSKFPFDFPHLLRYAVPRCLQLSKGETPQMDFYNNLQLDPFVLKKKIHNSPSAKDRKILFATMLIRSLLIVGFAILFISTINAVFGAENSFLAVVLFCMLLSIRLI